MQGREDKCVLLTSERYSQALVRNWEVTVAHTYREGNRCVDAMANYALSLPQGLHILENPSVFVSCIMIDDIVGVSFSCCCII